MILKVFPYFSHVELNCDKYDLAKDSVVLLEQLRTIDKKRLKDKVCHLDHQILLKIDKALEISLELYTNLTEYSSHGMIWSIIYIKGETKWTIVPVPAGRIF